MRTSGTALYPPDFVVVGQPKAGTTALYEMLRQHPGIFMTELKEPMFFAEDLRRRFCPTRSGPLPTTLEDYLALYVGAGQGQLRGEASTGYLVSRVAAQRLSSHRADTRIIAIFWEPADFLRSLHVQLLRENIESVRDLRLALSLEPQRRRGRRIPRRCYLPQYLLYSDHLRYTEKVRRRHEALPPCQVRVLIHEDFRRDNRGTVQSLLGFLGLDGTVPVAPVEANPSLLVRSQAADDLVHRVTVDSGPVSSKVKVAIKAVTPKAMRRRAHQVVPSGALFGLVPAPDPVLMAELRARMKPEVMRFGDYLGRDLVALWGYGDV